MGLRSGPAPYPARHHSSPYKILRGYCRPDGLAIFIVLPRGRVGRKGADLQNGGRICADLRESAADLRRLCAVHGLLRGFCVGLLRAPATPFGRGGKSKFFSFLSDSEGNGKKLDLPPRPKGVAGALKSPKQKPLKNPSTAQIRRKSAANSRKSAQIRPPFCNSAPFRPTRPLGKTMKIANPSGRQYPP